MNIFTSVITLTALVTPLAAQWAQYHTPGIPRTADGEPNLTAPAPRTADGHIDLTGLWATIGAGGNVAERSLGDLKPADVQPWAQELVKQRAENFGSDNPHYRCLPQGPVYSTLGGMKRFLQTPAMLAILDDDLTFRQIHMDGRALETDPNPSWMGYSVGRWDGDTLVVESFGYNDRTWLVGGYPHTEKLRMTERFRRPDFGHLELAVTFQDPGVFSKAWTVPLRATLAADTELLESVCNENPATGQQHWVGKASDAERAKVNVAGEILAKYTGVYGGQYLRGPRTVEVSLSGDSLYVAVNGGPKRPLVPLSETVFQGTGLSYEFIRDASGVATDVVEGHVSGDYKFARQK
jgi:hypothetical protein